MVQPKQYKLALLAFDGISAFHLSVPSLVFNDVFVTKASPFEVVLHSIEKTEMRNSAGLLLAEPASVESIVDADIVILPSWPDDVPVASDLLVETLKLAHANGALIVGLCLGAFVLAQAGLLDGKRATTHWAYSDLFQQRFPKVLFDSEPLFIEEAQLITSAGIVAALDCCLHILRRFMGNDVAAEMARLMVAAPFRAGGQQQYIPTPLPAKISGDTSFAAVMSLIEAEVNQSYSIDDVAERCAMSRRTFTRNFKAVYGSTFGEWLLHKRLQLSQTLLETSTLSIANVASSAGFGSESVYRKHFKQAFNVSPSQWRSTFCG
ncbi:AraC family transcriptional regulator [Shewanella sp. 1CM18E]|uniref:GlxA family transcriptional regulator n=1 Tax=Shewanella sp. 1CM18E TaxID=2929169 RepID=UPI0020C08775|nr:AraC family transcriptional regulator [Shewanella sp. 1CM18E]MCK8044510.1 AraC family transcriptional regulator [Shewanella sp. 1CM18E]